MYKFQYVTSVNNQNNIIGGTSNFRSFYNKRVFFYSKHFILGYDLNFEFGLELSFKARYFQINSGYNYILIHW